MRVMLSRGAIAFVLAAAALQTAPTAAQADVGEKIILRCTHRESIAGFTERDYRQALKDMLADTEEYSECSNLVRKAQEAIAAGGSSGGAGGGAGSGSSSGGSTGLSAAPITPTPQEAAELAHAASASPGKVPLGGASVAPGVVHANLSSAFSSLPTPVLAMLAFLLAALLTLGGHGLRKRISGDRTD